MNNCGKRHVGKCTTGRTFTRDEALTELAARGFTFNKERTDWERTLASGDLERGRLCWQPDYCNPDAPVGTKFWLRKPYGFDTITLLDGEG